MPRVPAEQVAWVDADQMIEIDRVMIDDLGVALIQMMENAGRNLARLAIDLFAPTSVSVYVGTGSNGGGGLVVGDTSVPPSTYASMNLTGGRPPLEHGSVLEIV